MPPLSFKFNPNPLLFEVNTTLGFVGEVSETLIFNPKGLIPFVYNFIENSQKFMIVKDMLVKGKIYNILYQVT